MRFSPACTEGRGERNDDPCEKGERRKARPVALQNKIYNPTGKVMSLMKTAVIQCKGTKMPHKEDQKTQLFIHKKRK